MHKEITFIPASVSLPGISVTEKWVDGALTAYRLTADEGFVMYDKTANHFTIDPVTGQEIPITYYYCQTTYPARYTPAVWKDRWVAVAAEGIPQDQIFGKKG